MSTLTKGSLFVQSYPGCTNSVIFEVLEIDRDRDYLKVRCTRDDCESDGLKFTEMAMI